MMCGAFDLSSRFQTLTNSRNRRLDLLMVERTEALGHFVQFYEQDDFLIERVAQLAAKALSGDNSVVLIATNSHLSGINCQLAKHGFDLNQLSAAGRYVVLDADDILSRLMLNDWPNSKRFSSIIGDIIHHAIQRSANQDFVFGELVDILCARDKPQAALYLEQLWNTLSKRYIISLWCAYKLSNFLSEAALNAVFQICAEHCMTFPAESV